MKNIFILSIGLLLIFSYTACSPKEYPVGNYQATTILADGNSKDWSLPLRFGAEDGLLQYNITNDKNNIYVSVATSDQATQMNILRLGIAVYFDTKGKTNKTVGLSFPANEASDGDRRNFRPIAGGANKTADQLNFKKQILMDKDIFKAFGFINMDNRIYDVSDTSHIKMGINYDVSGNLVFEAIVPIKNIYDKNFTAQTAPSLSVGIVVNSSGMSPRGTNNAGGESGMRNGGGGMRGGGGGMGGGMGGGGMRGGGGVGMGGGRRSGGGGMRGGGANGGGYTPKNSANWYQFKLAYSN